MKIPSQNVKLPSSAKGLDWEDREQLKPLYAIAAQMRLQNQIEAFKAGLITKDEVEINLLNASDSEPEKINIQDTYDLDTEDLAANSEIKADVELVTRESLRAPREDESELMYS